MVIISFETIELQKRCCEYATAVDAYGHLDGVALITLIADIEAAENCQEVIDIYGPEAQVSGDGTMSLDFGSGLRAIFMPVGNRFALDAEGAIEWQTVSRLKLTSIERPS
ncbi:hypothetical protein [Prosthecodimorpha staleyi]|uniref:Uncharacterized protein n=1 Tax=Prosthecodimorpha staleyi TaxID=2840188 RepID=A0A947D413_9HYPH|nr:hypothetical protein [Prosthecodimorpha staleyi]MBT9290401.1 hypothetical protein [Prosthecodimorpha staleyi]